MNIDIKFKVGDTIWFMYQNKPTIAKVRRVLATVVMEMENKITETVLYTPDNNTLEVGQYRCFSTKEELLKSL